MGALARLRERRGDRSVSMLTGTQIRNLKPFLIVRTPSSWRASLLLWIAVFYASLLRASLLLALHQFHRR